MNMTRATGLVFGLAVAALAGPSLAADHLVNGATAPGAAQRGFNNPVAANPSGKSVAAAQPTTVPGLGNPNAGAETGTPSVNFDRIAERLAGRGN